MADLPSLSLQIPQVRAPTPSVSPGQVAAPFQELANTLDKAGEAANTAAVELATEAGHQAVVRDADGNLTIEKTKLPLIGDAAPAYARAARFDYLARKQPEIENKATEFQLKFPGDPKGFQAAWNEFSKSSMEQETDPILKSSVANTLAHVGGQSNRSLQIQGNTLTVASTVQSLQARLVSLNDEGASLARQGGVETPEYERIHAQRAAIYRELTSNPLYHYSRDRADLELKDNRDTDVGQAIIGEGVKQFKSRQNIAAAQQWFEDKVWGPGSEKLNLTPAKRDHIISEGLKTLARVNVEDRVEVQAFRQGVNSYVGLLNKDPNIFDPIQHENLVTRANELGDFKTQQELAAAKLFVPVMQAVKGLPAAEKNAALMQIARGVIPNIPGAMTAPLAGDIRITSQFGARTAPIAGASTDHGGIDLAAPEGTPVVSSAGGRVIRAEKSGGYGNMVEIDHGNGTVTRYAHLGSIGVKSGDQVESGTQLGASGSTGTTTGPHLHFELLKDGKQIDPTPFVGGATGLVPGQPVASIRNPYAFKQWENFTKEIVAETGRNAERLATQVKEQADRGDGILPETIETLVTSIYSSGKLELLDNVRPTLEAYDAKQSLPAGQGAGAVLKANIAAITAAGVNPAKAAALHELGKMVDHDAELWRTAPLVAGAQAQTISPVHPINTANPQAASAEFADRQKKIMLLQHPAGHNLGPTSAIADENEGRAVATALTQGPADAAGTILSGMATSLNPETYKATMADPAMKQALFGMVRSHDPARMTAGFSTLDKLWRMDQWGFERDFKDEVGRLQSWQALKDFYSAEVISERLNKANDPSKVNEIADARKAAETEAKTWKPTDIAYQMGSAWGVPMSWEFQRYITGSTPDVPPTVIGVGDIADEMMHDFHSLYVEQRINGVPSGSFFDNITGTKNAKTMAAERLQSKWGISSVAGNQVMAYPPDSVTVDKDTKEKKGAYYPLINGSHAWMQDHLRDTITSIKGPETTIGPGEVVGGGVRTNWKFKGLIGDQQTQAEIAAGKSPSYRAVIDSGNGLNEILRDPKTGSDRIYWDPKKYLDEQAGRIERVTRTEASLRARESEKARAVAEFRTPRPSAIAMPPPAVTNGSGAVPLDNLE